MSYLLPNNPKNPSNQAKKIEERSNFLEIKQSLFVGYLEIICDLLRIICHYS